MISEKQLAEWERLANEATEGPWYQCKDRVCDRGPWHECRETDCYVFPIAKDAKDNARFIAVAREAVPQLIAEVRRLAKLSSEYFALAEQYDGEADNLAKCLGEHCKENNNFSCNDCVNCMRKTVKAQND